MRAWLAAASKSTARAPSGGAGRAGCCWNGKAVPDRCDCVGPAEIGCGAASRSPESHESPESRKRLGRDGHQVAAVNCWALCARSKRALSAEA